MAVFDQSLTVRSSPHDTATAIQSSYPLNTQCIALRPDTLLIVLQGETGHVYLLRPQDGNAEATQVRLIADTATCVRESFRGKQPKEALETLLGAPPDGDVSTQEAITHNANVQLTAIRQRCGGLTEEASNLEFALPSEPVSMPPINVISGPNEPTTDSPGSTSTLSKPAAISASGAKRLPGRMSKRALPAGPPWNPDQLSFWFIIGAPIAGIAMGINWRRLGKPEWMWTTILASILMPIVAVIGILLGVRLAQRSPVLGIPLMLLLGGLNWSYVLGLWVLQRGAYKQWEKTGSVEALLAHQYNFKNVLLVVGGCTLIFVVAGGIGLYNSMQPNTFESSDLTITYPNTWAVQDIKQVSNCKLPNVQCIIVVAEARFGFTNITLIKTALTVHPKTAELQSWESIKQSWPAAKMYSRSLTSIAGVSGYQRFYSIPNATDRGDEIYGMQIYFAKGNTLYELTAESLNYGIFREDEKAINQFVAGVKLK